MHCLQRHAYDSRATEIRRVALTVTLLIVASIAWHGLWDRLAHRVACSSVGLPCRLKLIAAAMRRTNPAFPTDADLFSAYGWNINTGSLPCPGWIAWQWVYATAANRDGSLSQKILSSFADRSLHTRGSLRWDQWTQVPPTDADGDDLWEIAIETEATPSEYPGRDVTRWGVVRLGDATNQVVWVGLVDPDRWARVGSRVKSIWRDEDADGAAELVFITVTTVRLPGGGVGFKPPAVVGVLEWEGPGGLLRPRSLPKDGTILSWVAPHGRAVEVSPNEELEPLLAKILPVPDGFGFGGCLNVD